MWTSNPADDPSARFEVRVAPRAVRVRAKNIADDVFTNVLIRNKSTVRTLHVCVAYPIQKSLHRLGKSAELLRGGKAEWSPRRRVHFH